MPPFLGTLLRSVTSTPTIDYEWRGMSTEGEIHSKMFHPKLNKMLKIKCEKQNYIWGLSVLYPLETAVGAGRHCLGVLEVHVHILHAVGTYLRAGPALGPPQWAPSWPSQSTPRQPNATNPPKSQIARSQEVGACPKRFLNSHPRVVAMCTCLHECISIHIIASETRIPPV